LSAVALLADTSRFTRPAVSFRIFSHHAIGKKRALAVIAATDLPAQGAHLTPQMLLEEIFLLRPYYQDTGRKASNPCGLPYLGARLPEFVPPLN